jgi:hypothetical protein
VNRPGPTPAPPASPLSAPQLSRRLRWSERQWPWLLATFALTFVVCVAAGALNLGLLEGLHDALAPVLRGYTLLGVLSGVAALFFVGAVFFYSLRKRWLQEQLPAARGTMAAWLWAHVYLGLFALVAALVHAGYGALSFQLSSGKLLLATLASLVFSGLLWRVVYAAVPPVAARSVGNYSEVSSLERAAAQLVEIDKLAAGRSPRFHELQRWALAGTPPARLRVEHASLPAEEHAPFAELIALAQDRARLLERRRLQARFARLLQGWRILHVPLSLLFVVLVPVHVILAYDVPARALPVGAIAGLTLGGFATADACESCHASIVAEWRQSMHAHAMTSPVMIAQTNQVLRRVLQGARAPDPQEICVNCHGPLGAVLTEQASLPLVSPLGKLGEPGLLNEGVSCAVCHQWQGKSHPGQAGLARFADGLEAGRVYYGPIADPVPNAFHRSERSALFREPSLLCQNCHSVVYDRDRDGRIVKGVDLVLQTLYDEWQDYAKAGGASCVACHMPVVARTRAADSASIPFEQDFEAPDRAVHDHSFVGVDYPLELTQAEDKLHSRRLDLLRGAGVVGLVPGSTELESGELSFRIEVANTGTGHNLPGGFAFVRQMWLEVTLKDAFGNVLASSGRIARPTDDLCDSSTLIADNPMRGFVEGCSVADPQLVNFQQQLVTRIRVARDAAGQPRQDVRGEPVLEADDGGSETWLQHIEGGPVPRKRPADGKHVPPLAAGERRSFEYRLRLPGAAPPASTLRLDVRMLFRPLPPYFVRALASAQPENEVPQLRPLLPNVRVFEMAAFTASVP